VLSLFKWLAEIGVYVLGENSIFEAISGHIVFRQGVHFHFVAFSPQIIVKSSALSPGFALKPIINLDKAEPGGQFLLFDAICHPLHEAVARMSLHIYRLEWLHYR